MEKTYPRREDVEFTTCAARARVNGYNIQAKDGEIGHIEDFIIDDETWRFVI